ncbi:MAG: hypothetical protein QW330_02245 [Nitrososphaerota archaeon]
MRVYKVVRCPKCGFLQLTAASRSVRCFGCGVSWALEPDSILFSSADLEKAREFLLRLKRGGSMGFKRASEAD